MCGGEEDLLQMLFSVLVPLTVAFSQGIFFLVDATQSQGSTRRAVGEALSIKPKRLIPQKGQGKVDSGGRNAA